MKFSSRQDIEAPIDFVFARITDFDSLERQAMRRGAEIAREDVGGVIGIGTKWAIRAKFRGKPRNVRSEITAFEPPNAIRILSDTGGLTAETQVELLALSPRRTRMTTGFELKPTSLTGRLLVQSLKFAKSTINVRLAKRTGDFAKTVEDRYKTDMA